MGSGRKVVVGLLAALLFFVITTGSFLASLSSVVTNRTYLKNVLDQDAVYNSLAKAVIEQPFQSVDNPTDAQAQTPSINSASLQKLVNQYLTRDWYKNSVNTAVDGIYAWLEGKTSVPDFIILITTDTAGFQQFIVDTVTTQYNSLPECTQDPSTITEINPLDASCQLPTFTDADVAAYIRSNANQQQFNQLFNNASINSRELFGQVDPKTTQNLQSGYKVLQRMPLIFMLSTLGLIGLLFLAVFNLRRSLKVVGVAILVPTALVLVSGLLGWLAKTRIVSGATPTSSQTSTAVADVARRVVGGMFSDANHQFLIYGFSLLAIALLSLMVYWWWGRASSAKPSTPAKPVASTQVKQ